MQISGIISIDAGHHVVGAEQAAGEVADFGVGQVAAGGGQHFVADQRNGFRVG